MNIISRDLREWCDEADVDVDSSGELRAIADRIDREMEEKERLKKENAELTAELDDWNGNAEGFQPYAYMRLPLDADGVPVRIGDKMDVDGDCMNVLGYRLYNGELLLLVKKAEGDFSVYTQKPSSVRHYKYSKPDSWEKLEVDATQQSCEYFGMDRTTASCDYCPHGWEQTGRACWQNARLDMIARAKKLAGIEEEAQR